MKLILRLAILGLLWPGVFLSVVDSEISAKERAPAKYSSVKIDGIPHVLQKPDFCGEACAAMCLQKLGASVDQDFVYDQSGLQPALGRGCYTKELAVALKRIGFDLGPVWHQVPAKASSQPLEDQFAALHQDLKRGHPSIICMHYAEEPRASEHFRLIVGYDSQTDEVLYHEPAEEDGAYRRMSRQKLLTLWPLKYGPVEWTLIRMRLKLNGRPPIKAAEGITNADYCQHIRALKERLPGDGFHIVIQRPFVVVGDETQKVVEQRATKTVKWAVDYLKKDYFDKDPQDILDIWLFKDETSYRDNVKALFNERPTTPFGYFSSKHKALIMNISTGGGTLVHEIVHPFMAANFTRCPSWFNEGLASLYEQCGEEDGHIRGETNWRLKGLQSAIEKQQLSTFEELCGTTTNQFYDDDKGTHYGQARYLCYYLQEQGLLRKYFQEFRRNSAADPTGFETLKKILNEQDMIDFQKRWEAYVLKLKF